MFFTQSLLYDISIITLLILGIFVAITYIFNNFKNGITQKIISFILVFLNIRIFLAHLYITKGILDYPHFLIVSNLNSRMAVPLLFLLVFYSLVRPTWKWYDIFHFLPALCFAILYGNIYFRSAYEKREMLLEMYEKGYDVIWTKGNWFNVEFIFLIRSAPVLIYVVLIISMLVWSDNFRQIGKTLRMFFIAVLCFTLVNLFPIFFNSMNLSPEVYAFYVNALSFATTFLLLIYFFFIPNFLYSKYFLKEEQNLNNKETQLETEMIEIPDTDVIELFELVNNYLEESKAYLDPEFNVQKLENALNISDRKISLAIKSVTYLSFSRYINDLRISYLLANADSNFLKGKTFNEIAFEIGFNSTNSFYAYFKEKNGCTPQIYFKKKLML